MRNIFGLVLVIMSSMYFNCYADEPPDSLASNLFDFLIMKGEIPQNTARDNKNDINFFYIQEILESSKKPSREGGIYKFLCKHDEESQYNVFIKTAENIEIYDIADISFLISRIIILGDKYPKMYDNNKIIKYISEVIILYNNACKSNLKNSSVEFNFGSYTYYISLENYSSSPR
jgi:hypothetical protein